jgi:hypothetical protein
MFKKVSVWSLLAISAITCGISLAQDAPKKTEEKEVTIVVDGGEPLINKEFRIFTNEDGNSYLGVQLQEVTKGNFGKFGLASVRGVAAAKKN